MALRKYKPTTAGTRWRIGNAYAEITTNVPEKTLLEAQKNTAGRNSQGRRSMRYMGGGNKTMYRIIDFKRDKKNIPAVVKSIEYDPNRTAFIALLNELPNVHFITTYYRWQLIPADPDDNKYCDCAIASQADYIVTEDKHFDSLRHISFPAIHTVSIEAFSTSL